MRVKGEDKDITFHLLLFFFSSYNAQLGLTTSSLKGFWTSWVGVYGVGSDGVVEES